MEFSDLINSLDEGNGKVSGEWFQGVGMQVLVVTSDTLKFQGGVVLT